MVDHNAFSVWRLAVRPMGRSRQTRWGPLFHLAGLSVMVGFSSQARQHPGSKAAIHEGGRRGRRRGLCAEKAGGRYSQIQRFSRMVAACHTGRTGLRAGSQLGHGALRHQLAVVDNGHAVAKALHHFQQVRGQEYSCCATDLIERDEQPRAMDRASARRGGCSFCLAPRHCAPGSRVRLSNGSSWKQLLRDASDRGARVGHDDFQIRPRWYRWRRKHSM